MAEIPLSSLSSPCERVFVHISEGILHGCHLNVDLQMETGSETGALVVAVASATNG